MSDDDDTRENLLDKLGKKGVQLQADAQDLLSQLQYPDISGLLKTLTGMMVWIALTLGQFTEQLSKFVEQRRKLAEHVLNVLSEHGVTTPPKRHSWIDTLLATMPLTLFEGVIVGMLMIAGGHMGVAAGFSYGMIFALINVIVGMIAGYFCLRYARYKINGSIQTPRDEKIRRRGKFSFRTLIGVLVFLFFVAARVRATGDHESILDFSSVNFFQTFNDAMAIVIIAVASASSFIAIYKGYMIDPVAGLSDAQHFATDAINADVETYVLDTDDMITDRIENTLEDAYDALENIEEVERKRKDILAKINTPRRLFNHEIDTAKNTLIANQRQAIDHYEKVKGVKVNAVPDLGLDAFDALKLPLISDADYDDADAAQAVELRALVSELEAALDDARSKIQVAHTQYRTSQPNLSPTHEPKGV